jgi:hypothetical protein
MDAPAARQMAVMRALIRLLLCAGLAFSGAQAQAQGRLYHQAELDAMLAPIALYPDGLLSQILIAATYPDEVAAAASWSRDNPQYSGQDAVNAVSHLDWDASVKSLVAFPDLLARMGESPQWTRDLGQAFLQQEPHVMDTVQSLRRRARESGHLQSNEQYAVKEQGDAIVVQPPSPQVVYVPYYDPYVVYGPWWWPAYRPMYWGPWAPLPVFFSTSFFYAAPIWHHHHVRVVHKPYYAHHSHTHVVPGRWKHRPSQPSPGHAQGWNRNRPPSVNAAPPVRRVEQHHRGVQQRSFENRSQQRSFERRQQPSFPQRSFEQRQQLQRQAQMPAAPAFSQPQQRFRSETPRQQFRSETPRQQFRSETPRQQFRGEARQFRGNGRG